MPFTNLENWAYILLGLILGSLASLMVLRRRFEAKELEQLGCAISTLFQLYSEIRLIKANLDAIATISDNTARFEAVRQYALRKFVRNDEPFKHDISQARKVIARYLPLASFPFDKILQHYEYFQNASFDEDARDSNTYILKLTRFGNSFARYYAMISQMIRALAYRHSLFTWIHANIELILISRRSKIKRIRKSKTYLHLEAVYQSISPATHQSPGRTSI